MVCMALFAFLRCSIPMFTFWGTLGPSTNDAVSKDSESILKELLDIKCFFEERYPESEFVISCPTIRSDNEAANITIRNLGRKLKELQLPIISHDNVDSSCLGKGALHLNAKGSGRLAMNFISYNRSH